MKIALPDQTGRMVDYTLSGTSIAAAKLGANPARVVYSAAHVVADPFTANDPTGRASVDWDKTMEFRRYLAELGLGIAEAMDTAQRGMGLDWPGALELIRRTKAELPDALVANGCGTDHLPPGDHTLDQVQSRLSEPGRGDPGTWRAHHPDGQSRFGERRQRCRRTISRSTPMFWRPAITR